MRHGHAHIDPGSSAHIMQDREKTRRCRGRVLCVVSMISEDCNSYFQDERRTERVDVEGKLPGEQENAAGLDGSPKIAKVTWKSFAKDAKVRLACPMMYATCSHSQCSQPACQHIDLFLLLVL